MLFALQRTKAIFLLSLALALPIIATVRTCPGPPIRVRTISRSIGLHLEPRGWKIDIEADAKLSRAARVAGPEHAGNRHGDYGG